MAQPLTEQLKKDSFSWSIAATEAFENLKQRMMCSPVLAMPNFKVPFVVETDASGHGIGAVLMQADRPIAFFSKLLGVRAQLKSVYEKELIAICLAVQKWKHYRLGRHFTIRTDQQSLRFIMHQWELGTEFQKWVSKLIGFDFDITYRTGTSNRVADALSRRTEGEVVLNAMVTSSFVDWKDLQNESKKDSFISLVMQDIQTAMKEHAGFTVKDGKLFYKNRFVIPKASSYIPILLKEYHNSPVGGHSSELKTYLRLAGDWFWQGTRKKCKELCSAVFYMSTK